MQLGFLEVSFAKDQHLPCSEEAPASRAPFLGYAALCKKAAEETSPLCVFFWENQCPGMDSEHDTGTCNVYNMTALQ